MKLVLRKVPRVPVCDVHIEFPKKPKIWDDLPDSDPTKPTADQVKLTDWPPTWGSSYDSATGILTIESSDCEDHKLRVGEWIFSFLVEDTKPAVDLGKSKVSLTDKAHKEIAGTKAGHEKELD